MKKTEFIQKLSELAQISAAELTAAFAAESEDVNVSLPEMIAFDKAEHESILAREKQKSYTEGKDAEREMVIKELKVKEGLEFEGKNPQTFLEKLKEKYIKESGKTTEEKDLEIERLKQELQKTAGSIDEIKSTYEQKIENQTLRTKLLGITDRVPDGFEKDEVLDLYLSKNRLKVEGENIIKVNEKGDPIQNERYQNINAIDDYKSWLDKRAPEKQPAGGRGGEGTEGKTNNYSHITNMKELNEYFAGANPPITDFNEKQSILNEVKVLDTFKV